MAQDSQSQIASTVLQIALADRQQNCEGHYSEKQNWASYDQEKSEQEPSLLQRSSGIFDSGVSQAEALRDQPYEERQASTAEWQFATTCLAMLLSK